MYVCMYTQSLSRVWLFGTPWTVAHQAPLSMRLPRQEYWSGFLLPLEWDLPHPGIKPTSPALADGFFTTEPPVKVILSLIAVNLIKNKLCCSNWFFWGIFQMSTTDTESYDFCYFSCFKLTSIFYYHFISWGVICGLYLQSKKYFFAKKLIEKINWWQINFWREDIMKYISLNLNIRQ